MDFNSVYEIFKEVNIGQLIAIGIMLGFMYSRIEKKFEKIDQRFEKIESRLSKSENDMIEVKTILRMKECCMIQDERKLPKAE